MGQAPLITDPPPATPSLSKRKKEEKMCDT